MSHQRRDDRWANLYDYLVTRYAVEEMRHSNVIELAIVVKG